jgi:sterol desaturase/sphingolipid hydroxylase (fatty acid hydroxylase superfamily)
MSPFEVLMGTVLVILVLAEFLDAGFRRRLTLPDVRLRRNLAYLGATMVAMACVSFIADAAQRGGFALIRWPGLIPLQVVACFLVVELLGWLLHFVKHVNGFLWKFHLQHHREEHFDIWLSTHTHALEVIVSSIVIATTAAVLGFAPVVIQLYVAVYTIVKVYQHSAHAYSLGPLDRIVVGPTYHRLHHERGSRCNFAVTLTVFDVMFGTARWPDRGAAPVAVGVDDPGIPFGFWREMGLFLRRPSRRVPPGPSDYS